MEYVLQEILDATGGNCVSTGGRVCGVSKDTRTIEKDNLYVALIGEQFNGHAYVAQALEKGASFALVSALQDDAPEERQILVKDTLEALQQLARWRRQQFPRVAGITGSVGKTSAKEMLAHCAKAQKKTYATQGNYNNHIGLPLTIANAPKDTEALVLEMGMNHAGEIALLSEIAKPDAAMITTIDAVHLEFFDSVEGIAHAKAEIVQGMEDGAPVILPKDSAYIDVLAKDAEKQHIITFGAHDAAEYRLLECSVSINGTVAKAILAGKEHTLQIKAAGRHHAINALGVLALSDALGLNSEASIKALEGFSEPAGRGVIETINWNGGSISIIDETYNASPVAMKAAFTRARDLSNGRRVIAVIGDMLELGDASAQLHAELASPLSTHEIHHIYACGRYMKALKDVAPHVQYHASQDMMIDNLINNIQPDDIIICKGSRGSKMERVIAAIKSA